MRKEEEHKRGNTYDMTRPEDGEDTGHFPHSADLVADDLFTHGSGATWNTQQNTQGQHTICHHEYTTLLFILLLLIMLAIT